MKFCQLAAVVEGVSRGMAVTALFKDMLLTPVAASYCL